MISITGCIDIPEAGPTFYSVEVQDSEFVNLKLDGKLATELPEQVLPDIINQLRGVASSWTRSLDIVQS